MGLALDGIACHASQQGHPVRRADLFAVEKPGPAEESCGKRADRIQYIVVLSGICGVVGGVDDRAVSAIGRRRGGGDAGNRGNDAGGAPVLAIGQHNAVAVIEQRRQRLLTAGIAEIVG